MDGYRPDYLRKEKAYEQLDSVTGKPKVHAAAGDKLSSGELIADIFTKTKKLIATSNGDEFRSFSSNYPVEDLDE